MVGDQDPMGPKASEIIRDRLSRGSLRILPGRGHWIHVEAAEEVAEAIARWLEDQALAGNR